MTPIHAGYDEKHSPLAILGTGVLEFGDFVMLRAIMSEPSVATGKRVKPLTGHPR